MRKVRVYQPAVEQPLVQIQPSRKAASDQEQTESIAPIAQPLPPYKPLAADWVTSNNLMRSLMEPEQAMQPLQAKRADGQAGSSTTPTVQMDASAGRDRHLIQRWNLFGKKQKQPEKKPTISAVKSVTVPGKAIAETPLGSNNSRKPAQNYGPLDLTQIDIQEVSLKEIEFLESLGHNIPEEYKKAATQREAAKQQKLKLAEATGEKKPEDKPDPFDTKHILELLMSSPMLQQILQSPPEQWDQEEDDSGWDGEEEVTAPAVEAEEPLSEKELYARIQEQMKSHPMLQQIWDAQDQEPNEEEAYDPDWDGTEKHPIKVKIKSSNFFSQKTQKIIGKEKAGSLYSREESEKALANTSVDGRVAAIIEVLTSGLNATAAFKRLSFLLEGKADANLKIAFVKQTGQNLQELITQHFTGKPGSYTAKYLNSILDNNGEVPLKSRVALTLGLVDSPRMDEKRLLDLAAMAKPGEWHEVWGEFEGYLGSYKRLLEHGTLDRRIVNRLSSLANVSKAEKLKQNAEASGDTEAAKKQQAKLPELRDHYLASMVYQRVNVLLEDWLDMEDDMLNDDGLITTGVDTKALLKDVMKWKETATPEDLAYIKTEDSAFRGVLETIPTNYYSGMSEADRKFLLQLVDLPIDLSKGDVSEQLNVGKAKLSIERQQKKGWFVRKLNSWKGKWAPIKDEIAAMSVAERKKLLAEHYGADLVKFEQELKTAGLNKEERAPILAYFETKSGEAGDTYQELKSLAVSGKLTKVERFFKATKFSEVALKLVANLKGSEYAQVRQDTKLLETIEKRCGKDGANNWEKIKLLLGLNNALDPKQDETDAAKDAAELDPKHWATLIGFEIPKTSQKIRANSDNVISIVQRAQAAAERYAAKSADSTAATKFLQAIFDNLKGFRQDYIKNHIKPAHEALKANKPITVDYRLEKADKAFYRVDRQQLAKSFLDLEGKQLLEEWSNIKEFRQLRTGLKATQDKALEINGRVSTLKDQIGQTANPEEQEKLRQELQVNQQALVEQAGLGDRIQREMNTFVFGISLSRRRDLQQAKRLRLEDQRKLEKLLTEKLINAAANDAEVKLALQEAELPFDEWMQFKMKAVDALEMQRYLDSTRQWHHFSNKSAQLDEANRKFVGTARSREVDVSAPKTKGKTPEDIAKLKQDYTKKAESELEDRNAVESGFRAMQEKMAKRAKLILKLIITAIVSAISIGVSAATYGAATPVSIGVMLAVGLALGVGSSVLEGAFDAVVLKKPMDSVVANTLLSILQNTVSATVSALAPMLNLALLSPGGFVEGAKWMSEPIAKSILQTLGELVTLAPEKAVKRFVDQKSLEQAILDGEGTIGQGVLELAKGGIQAATLPWIKNITTAGLTQLSGMALEQIKGAREAANTKPEDRTFNQQNLLKDYEKALKIKSAATGHSMGDVLKDTASSGAKDVAKKGASGAFGEIKDKLVEKSQLTPEKKEKKVNTK